MHLFPLMLWLTGCTESPPPPPPPKPMSATAKAKAAKAKGKGAPSPAADPDLSDFPAKDGEQIGCPPAAKYTVTENAEGITYWCSKDGKKHGNYLRNYPDGRPAAKGGYLDGQEDGLWTTWHETGEERESRGTWNHGRQLGTWIYWSETGLLALQGDYLNGRRAGVWTEYDPKGRVWKEGMYVNDLKNGNWTVYRPSEEGIIDHLEVWDHGNLTGEAKAPIVPPTDR